LLSFSPIASVEDQRLITFFQNNSIILFQKQTHLSNLIAKNAGKDYILKLEMIKISEIISDIYFIASFTLKVTGDKFRKIV
jgi:hypothetical protein